VSLSFSLPPLISMADRKSDCSILTERQTGQSCQWFDELVSSKRTLARTHR